MIDFSSVRLEVEGLLMEGNDLGTLIIVPENTFPPNDASEYISLTEQDTEAEQVEMDSSIREVKSLLIVQIFTGLGSGTQRAKQIASLVSGMIEGYSGGIAFGMPYLISAGPVEDSDYYQHNLFVPYSYFYGQDD